MRRLAAIAALALALAPAARAEEAGFLRPADPGQIPLEATLDLPRAGKEDGGARSVAFSADGKWLAAGTPDGGVHVADVSRGVTATAWRTVLQQTGAVAGVGFARDSAGERTFVLSAGDAGSVVATPLEGAAGKAAPASVSLSAGLGPITALLALDGGRFVLGTASGVLVAGTFADGALAFERPAPGAHEGPVVALVAVNGTRIASAGWDGRVRLADRATLKEIRAARVSKLELTALAASADGKTLAAGGWARGIQLLDAGSLKPRGEPVETHRGVASALALAPGRLVSSSIADELLAITDLAKPATVLRSRPQGVPCALALSPDGSRIAVSTYFGSVLVYRIPEADRAPR